MANNASNQENAHNDVWYPDILDTTGAVDPTQTSEAVRQAYALIYSLRKKVGSGGGGTGPPGPPGTNGDDSIPILLPNQTFQGQLPPVGTPSSHTPSSTNTGTGVVTFASNHGWVTGTRGTVASTGGGLTAGTTYYINALTPTTAAFFLTVATAQANTGRVTLTASITSAFNPDGNAIATIPSTAFAAALVTCRNEGQVPSSSNWLISFKTNAPTTTSYSAKLGPGDSTLGVLGEAYTEEQPPIGDIMAINDNPSAAGAGVLAWFACYNDGTSPLAGPTGPAGSSWFVGSGAPSGGLGNNGDFYLNSATSDVYEKIVGSWTIVANIKGGIGPTGLTGATGQYGGAITMDYLFNTSTTNADPGTGFYALNNSTQNTATAIYIDVTSNDGVALATVLDNLTNSSSTNKAMLRIIKKTDQTKFLLFYITGETTHSGYREFAITNIASSTASPFSASDECLLCVDQIGDKGSTGSTGPAGGMLLITDTLLSVDTASVTFSSISGTFINLYLTIYGRTSGATTDDGILMQFNGDTGTNYDSALVFSQTGTANGQQNFGATSISVGNFPGTSATTTTQTGSAIITIPNYSKTTFDKTSNAISGGKWSTSSSGIIVTDVFGAWRNQSAITSIKLFPSTGGNFKAGSRFTLYGM